MSPNGVEFIRVVHRNFLLSDQSFFLFFFDLEKCVHAYLKLVFGLKISEKGRRLGVALDVMTPREGSTDGGEGVCWPSHVSPGKFHVRVLSRWAQG